MPRPRSKIHIAISDTNKTIVWQLNNNAHKHLSSIPLQIDTDVDSPIKLQITFLYAFVPDITVRNGMTVRPFLC